MRETIFGSLQIAFEAFDFSVQPLDRFTDFLLFGNQLISFPDQNIFARFIRLRPVSEQCRILDQRIDRHPGAAHAFDEIDPTKIVLLIIPDTAVLAGHRRDQTFAFIVAQRCGCEPGYFCGFRYITNTLPLSLA